MIHLVPCSIFIVVTHMCVGLSVSLNFQMLSTMKTFLSKALYFITSHMSLTTRKTGQKAAISMTPGAKVNSLALLHGMHACKSRPLLAWEMQMNNNWFIAISSHKLNETEIFLFPLLKLKCKQKVLTFVCKIGKDTLLRQTGISQCLKHA